MNQRYTASSLIEWSDTTGEYNPDLDKYRDYHASTPEKAVELASKASLTNEAYRLVHEYEHPDYGWTEDEYLDVMDYYTTKEPTPS